VLQLPVSVAVKEDKDKLDNVGAQLDVRSGLGSPLKCVYVRRAGGRAGYGNFVPRLERRWGCGGKRPADDPAAYLP
jgi:hypothetical protein